jgi:hypothetical protein
MARVILKSSHWLADARRFGRSFRWPCYVVAMSLLSSGCTENSAGAPSDNATAGQPVRRNLPERIKISVPPALQGTVDKIRGETKITNRTGQVLHGFTTASSSCGCLRPQFDHQELAPDAEGTLRMEMAVNARTGSLESTAVISTDEGYQWEVTLSGIIHPRWMFTPTKLFCADVEAGKEYEKTFTFERTFPLGEGPVSPPSVSIESPSAALVVTTLRHEKTIDGQFLTERFEYLARLRPPAMDGQSLIYIDGIKNQPDYGVAMQSDRVTLYWTARKVFSISPSRAFFGVVKPADREKEMSVIVTNKAGAAWNVKHVRCGSEFVDCAVTSRTPQSVVVTVKLHATGLAEDFLRTNVEIETDDPTEPKIVIPVTAIGEKHYRKRKPD